MSGGSYLPRIRTYKPKFLRHELLQELEVKYYKLKPMLVFLGLWSLSDKAGRFEWKPKTMKLDILPFIKFDIEESMMLLVEHEFVTKYEVAGKHYGQVDTFTIHQRISGKEAQESSHLPSPVLHGEAVGKQLRKQEGNGVQEQEQEGSTESDPPPTCFEKVDIEPPKNLPDLIEKIARLHPANWRELGNRLIIPPVQCDAIGRAIEAHGVDLVLSGTKNYAEAVAKWPTPQRKFVSNVVKFYSEEEFLRDPEIWEQGNGQTQQLSKTEERFASNARAAAASLGMGYSGNQNSDAVRPTETPSGDERRLQTLANRPRGKIVSGD